MTLQSLPGFVHPESSVRGELESATGTPYAPISTGGTGGQSTAAVLPF